MNGVTEKEKNDLIDFYKTNKKFPSSLSLKDIANIPLGV